MTPRRRAELDTTFGEDDGRKAHIALVADLRSAAEVEALSGSTDNEPREE
jgi:hypothetical protein